MTELTNKERRDNLFEDVQASVDKIVYKKQAANLASVLKYNCPTTEGNPKKYLYLVTFNERAWLKVKEFLDTQFKTTPI